MTPDPRDRITNRVNRARLELEVRRSRRPALAVVACAVIGLLFMGYVIRHVSRTALRSTYEARFSLNDATGIVPGLHEVRFKGVPVGTITKLGFRDRRPVVTVKVKSGLGPLYRGVRAQLRPNTALQDMYLDIIDRGSAAQGRLGDGEVVPASQTALPVNVDDVLDVLKPSGRSSVRTMLNELGNGVQGRGRQLESVLVEAVPLLDVAGRISANLRARAPQVRRLVHNTAVLTHELGQRQNQLRTLVREGSATFGTLQAGSSDLDATLRGLPPTLAAIDSSFAAVRGVLGDVNGAVTSLQPVARRLDASLTSLRELNDAAGPAVDALGRPVRRLVPLAQTLQPLSANLATAIEQLQPQIDTVNKVTRGLAACKKGFQGFFQWNASMSKFGDSRGGVPRGNVVVGAQSSSVLNDPNEYAPQACVPGKPMGGRAVEEKDKH